MFFIIKLDFKHCLQFDKNKLLEFVGFLFAKWMKLTMYVCKNTTW